MATKYQIAEQVISLLNDGDTSAGSGVDIREVILLVGQVCNRRIKAEYFTVDINTAVAGETRPFIMGEYVLKVEEHRNTSKADLPVMPIKLPMGQGVWEVNREDDPFNEMCFIPIPSGAKGLMEGMLSKSLGQVGYIWEGKTLYFDHNIFVEGVRTLSAKLIVVDVNSLDEFEPLPITADMEADVLTEVYQIVSQRGFKDNVVDSATDKTRQIRQQ